MNATLEKAPKRPTRNLKPKVGVAASVPKKRSCRTIGFMNTGAALSGRNAKQGKARNQCSDGNSLLIGVPPLPKNAPTAQKTSATHFCGGRRRQKSAKPFFRLSTSEAVASRDPLASDSAHASVADQNPGGGSLATVIRVIRSAHKQQQLLIKLRIGQESRVGSAFRTHLGWSLKLDEDAREDIRLRAAAMAGSLFKAWKQIGDEDAIIADIESGKLEFDEEQDRDYAKELVNVSGIVYRSTLPLRLGEEAYGKAITKSVEDLPVWEWAEPIKGFGAVSLGRIVAEADTQFVGLSSYPRKQCLWKRFGLAPYQGHLGAAWKREDYRERPLTPEEWMALGYSPRRRSFMYVIGESLMKKKSIYRDAYEQRRVYECKQHPEFLTGKLDEDGKPKVIKHCDLRARVVMEKNLLADLLAAWKRLTPKQLDNQRE